MYELISPPGDRADESGRSRFIAQRGPDLGDADVEPTLEVNECVVAPDRLMQFFAGNNLARVSQEVGEDHGGLRLQADQHPVAPQFSVCVVELE
jgi:hypothetical protein